MPNIHDYLQWRGDISLVDKPFNDVDNVILSILSYLDFTGIVPGEGSFEAISLRRACQLLLQRSGGDVTPYVRSLAKVDTLFVRLIAESRRFGAAMLSAYVDKVDPVRALQFSAMQIDLRNGETYVAFRGTDNTLVGWREDFMLSFEVTEAQREAAAYLGRVLARTQGQGRTLRVGGHSKGGNLAEFAALRCTDEQRKRIVRVYSNDGPGMSPEVMQKDSRAVLGQRLVCIVPAYSVVGMIYARPYDRRVIVESNASGIAQHDPTTWQTRRSGFVSAPQLQQECIVLNKAIAKWARSIPIDERKRVVNDVFDALGCGGATTFDEITASPAGLQQVLAALGNTDTRTRELVRALVEGTIDNSMSNVRKVTQDTFDQWMRGAQVIADDAVRRLQASGGEVRVPVSRLRPRRT